ncbi:MAG: SDR family NAD(P)-dependent oxidoreductase, partial [Candidatus Poribacteria bacterium]|nr:SDR family NAD(P)-dependent oxidoreductase [Candidatus Poribacteria bacterium]
MDLSGKVAIVTGSGQGIGRAIALRLAGSGANLVLVDLNLATAKVVAKEIEGLGRKALPVQTDVSRFDQVQNMAQQTLETFNQIDILVNNAGITGKTAPLTQLDESDWDAVIDVNLKGVFLC